MNATNSSKSLKCSNVSVFLFLLLSLCTWYYFQSSNSQLFQGDAKDYLAWSYEWNLTKFRSHHVPGWPAIFWLFRKVTFGILSDVYSVYILLSFSSIVSILYEYKIALYVRPSSEKYTIFLFTFFHLWQVNI